MLNLVLLSAANINDDDEEAMVRYFFISTIVFLYMHPRLPGMEPSSIGQGSGPGLSPLQLNWRASFS